MKLLIAFLFLVANLGGVYTANCTTVKKIPACPATMKINWWNIAPYAYKKNPQDIPVIGIFRTIVEKLVLDCCGCGTKFDYNINAATDSEELKSQIGVNNSDLAFPIYGSMTNVKFQNRPYFPVVESPGVIYIESSVASGNAASSVMMAVFQGWPVLVLTLIMAAMSGIVMWALDSYWNPDEFPTSFFHGSWEGFWWAFVSMTTVGYGDRAPRSFLARIFAFFWILIGLVIISIFTATVTASLTALSLSNDITLYGSTIVTLENTEEQRYGVQNNAKVKVRKTVQEFADAIVNVEEEITGGLIDSYVAGHEKDKLSKDLRVGTVFDHQFAYGFVVSNSMDNTDVEKCLRRRLSTLESWITERIQNEMSALPEPEKSAAEEKSSNLFDPKGEVFQRAVFTCLGLIALLTICGIIWEYCYWKPKEKKENPVKADPDRVVTPHTSFEGLVAAQCQELEDAMITEVMAFYKGFNRKIDDFRKADLRDDKLGLDEKKNPEVWDFRDTEIIKM